MAYKYQLLYKELKGMAERLPERSQLPSVRNLMDAYGVSQATVDKAINALRANRIIDAVGGEGFYVMPKSAKEKRPDHLKICMAQNDYPSSIFAMIERSFEDFFTKAGHEFQVVRYPWAKGLSSMLKPGLMDAFIASPSLSLPELSEKELSFLRSLEIPAIYLSSDTLAQGIDSITTDAELGGMLGAEHLLKSGHRKLAFLHGEPNSPLCQAKFNGFKRQCLLAGLGEPQFIDFGTKSGELSMRNAFLRFSETLKKSRGSFTGVMTDSDHCAIGIIRACHEAGIEIPGELSLVGFNDTPESEFAVPSITTIHHDLEAWAAAAFDIIIGRLVGGVEKPVAKHISPSLIIRESSGPVKK